MNPNVNFGAELPHKTNLRLNSSATKGSPMVHVANPPRPSSNAGDAIAPRMFTGRPAGSAAVPPQATVIGPRAPAPPVRAPVAPDRATAWPRAQIHEAMPVEAREAMVPAVVNLLHHGRYVGVDRGPRLRQGGSRGGRRHSQQPDGNQPGCQRQFSDHGSIPSFRSKLRGARPVGSVPAH